MKTLVNKLFSVVFVVLAVAMFSGCSSTTSPSADYYQGFNYDRGS